MNLPSPAQEPSQPAGAPTHPDLQGAVGTAGSHRWFVLIGIGFLVFECFFLIFYGSDFWFGLNVSWLGVPAVIVALSLSHLLLSWAESPAGCSFFAPIWKGKPPIVYRRWLTIDESGITFGTRHVIWRAIDELALTFFGNVQVRSRSLCGEGQRVADLVLKFPLGVAPLSAQAALVDTFNTRRPAAKLNARLLKRKAAREVKGAVIVQASGVIFMLAILCDVGNSTFHYLQMMKEYYLAQTDARDGQLDAARAHFESAEDALAHPPPLSWVTGKLVSKGAVAAGVQQSRSEALWALGRKDEAVDAARKAIELNATAFRLNLRLARLLAALGDGKGARAQVRLAIDNHDDSLLPRLYMLALLKTGSDPREATRFYNLYLQELTDIVFGQEPWWPPGGNRYLHEIIYKDDTTFILDRLIGPRPDELQAETNSGSQPGPAGGKQ